MAKSRKKKSSKKQRPSRDTKCYGFDTSLGALGLGLYQIFVPPGPTVHSLIYDDQIDIDGISIIDYLSELSLTYSAKEGDRVLVEFNCEIYLNPVGTTDLTLNFDIQGAIYPTSRIRVYSDSVIFTTGYMRHYIESSGAGLFQVQIYASLDDEFATSYIRNSYLTVTVY